MRMHKPAYFSDHDVRVRAYLIWEREGRPEGQAEAFWHQAIAELEEISHPDAVRDRRDHVPPHPGVSNPPARTEAAVITKKD
jgi:hypothetical protein